MNDNVNVIGSGEQVVPQADELDIEPINNNDEILKMHKQGKSNVAIAKHLGMGVGEVKLVIDLYENGI